MGAYLEMEGIESDRFSGWVVTAIAGWRMELEVGSNWPSLLPSSPLPPIPAMRGIKGGRGATSAPRDLHGDLQATKGLQDVPLFLTTGGALGLYWLLLLHLLVDGEEIFIAFTPCNKVHVQCSSALPTSLTWCPFGLQSSPCSFKEGHQFLPRHKEDSSIL